MDKGTIVYIGGFELPDKNAAAHRVVNNGKILRDLGYDIIFIGISKNSNPGISTSKILENNFGFTTYSFRYPEKLLDWFSYITSIKQFIDIIERCNNVQGVILYNFPAISLHKMIIYCHQRKIKCICDVTEWYLPKGGNKIRDLIKKIDTWYRMKILHHKTDGVIVISRYLQNYYMDSIKTVFLPPLTDLNEKKWIKQDSISNMNTLNLVYAGSPGNKDKISILINSLMFVEREYHLDIVGITKTDYLRENPRHEYFLLNNEKISFHGRLTHRQTLDYVKRANYSCFFRDNDLSTIAGFPTKFAEAISCGTPVITNNTSNISEYIKDNNNGILIEEINYIIMANILNNLDPHINTTNNIFHYENYTCKMKKFIDSIFSNS